MKIIVHGYTGRMGQIIVSMAEQNYADFEIVAKVSPDCPLEGNGCYAELSHFTGDADCIIDFSNHAATETLLGYAMEKNLPIVICTTGHTDAELKMIEQASKEIPVFRSANMSLGIALLADLARKAASAFPQANIEIIETHHNRKVDVPSGTALLLAEKLKEARKNARLLVGRHENGKRTDEEIGIHSIRLGNEVGTHEILISTGNETITLKHKAENRALFAEGAFAAAKFLCNQKPGLYTMQDIVA